MNILLLMMGGKGSRFGGDVPKQYVTVVGKPVFLHILEGYDALGCIDSMVVVSNPDFFDETREHCCCLRTQWLVTSGGTTRSHSVRNGLRAAAKYARQGDVVLIHDATHPYVDPQGTKEVIESTKRYGAATLGSCNYDTVYQLDEELGTVQSVLPRKRIISGASPEAFRYEIISGIYEQASEKELESMTSAGAIALKYNVPMRFVKTDILNLKITHTTDMQLFTLLQEYYFPISERNQ